VVGRFVINLSDAGSVLIKMIHNEIKLFDSMFIFYHFVSNGIQVLHCVFMKTQ